MEFLGGVLFVVFCLPAVFGFALGWTIGSRKGREQVATAFAAIEEAKAILAKYKEGLMQDLLTESPGRDIHLKGN